MAQGSFGVLDSKEAGDNPGLDDCNRKRFGASEDAYSRQR